METKKANSIFLWSFLIIGLTMQVVAYHWAPTHPISLISGLLGICSVLLCSQGNILTFYFGFGQIATYTYVCYIEHLYGAIAMNVFYFAMQVYGLVMWRRRGATSAQQTLRTRSLSRSFVAIGALVIVVISWIVGYLLAHFTDDTQPYLDSFTTVPAIAAQILMALAYREQWSVWLMVDLLYLILWARAGNYCMFMQYAFWCINCVYGYIVWTKNIHTEETAD